MVVNQTRSEFANKLYQALKDAGFFYSGKINLTEEEFNSYKDLSPKEMAQKYATAHALAEKSKIFFFIKRLEEDTVKGVKTFKLRESIIEAKLRQAEYMWAFQNHPDMFKIDGVNNYVNRRYLWVRDSKPIFSDAEVMYNYAHALKDFKLNPKMKAYVKENCELSFEDLNGTLNPSNDLFINFAIQVYRKQVRSQQITKAKPKKPIIPDKEISRRPIVNNTLVDVELDEVDETSNEVGLSRGDDLLTSLQNVLTYQIKLNEALETYYALKFEAQEKYIESLQETISQRNG